MSAKQHEGDAKLSLKEIWALVANLTLAARDPSLKLDKMSSVASPSRSSSPGATEAPPPVSIPKKKKQKTKHAAGSVAHGKNEGSDPHAAYQPPPNAVLLEHAGLDYVEFDWDAVNANEDCEVWLVRIPDSIKPKYLENLPLELPPSSAHSTKIGTFNRKHANYDIWAIGESDDSELPVVGEEIRNLSCLLPRKSKKGKLYPAPKPITRRLVFAAQPVIPSSDQDTPAAPILYQNPPRHSYPKELLKHRFMPFGSEVPAAGTTAEVAEPTMQVDTESTAVVEAHAKEMDSLPPTSSQPVKEKTKTKKRKGHDGEATPKKPKKVKTST